MKGIITMSNLLEITEIKKRLKEIRKEQTGIDKMIAKQEDDGNFDDKLYSRLNELEDERNNLQMQLDELEK